MPCYTGRSAHVLCKKDCQSGCLCCNNTAYSVKKTCCNDILINEQKPLVGNLITQILLDGAEQGSCGDLLGAVSSSVNNLPEKHCKVVVTVNNITTSDVQTLSIEDRNVELQPFNSDPEIGDDLQFLVDGVEVLTCTV